MNLRKRGGKHLDDRILFTTLRLGISILSTAT